MKWVLVLHVGGTEFSVNNELQLFWVCGQVYEISSRGF